MRLSFPIACLYLLLFLSQLDTPSRIAKVSRDYNVVNFLDTYRTPFVELQNASLEHSIANHYIFIRFTKVILNEKVKNVNQYEEENFSYRLVNQKDKYWDYELKGKKKSIINLIAYKVWKKIWKLIKYERRWWKVRMKIKRFYFVMQFLKKLKNYESIRIKHQFLIQSIHH